MKNDNTVLHTISLFLDTLTKIGCQYKIEEGDSTKVLFDYQGVHFLADTKDDNVYVHIWNTYWNQVELCDIDEVSRMKEAINSANLNTTVITMYSIRNDTKTMYVHTKSTIPFVSSIPALEEYLRTELKNFFLAHHMVYYEMNKLRVLEKQET